jgi:MFS family permease
MSDYEPTRQDALMSPGSATDEIIIAQLRRRQRAAKWVVLAVAIASALGGLLAYYFGRGSMSAASWWAVAAAVAVALAAAIWLLRTPAAAYEPRFVAQRTDELQRSRARVLWLFPVQILLFAPTIVKETQHILDRGADQLLGLPREIATTGYLALIAIGLLAMMVATLMNLMGKGYPNAIRTVMDDELSRAQRAKAIASGFLASFVGGLIALAAGLIQPRWAVLALPFVIMGSLAVAAVHFAILDRQADASG